MSDEVFWRTQPKRLKALIDVHRDIYGGSSTTTGTGTTATRRGFIDQVL